MGAVGCRTKRMSPEDTIGYSPPSATCRLCLLSRYGVHQRTPDSAQKLAMAGAGFRDLPD